LETPTGAYRPWTPRNPLCDACIVWFLGMVLIRWSVCVLLHADTQKDIIPNQTEYELGTYLAIGWV